MSGRESALRRMPGWIARVDREEVYLSGTALLADGREIPVEIRNLSRDGCRVSSDETLSIGESITLNAAPLEGVAGTVRWSLFGTAGIRFTSALA